MAYDEELADRIREALAHVPVARTYNRNIAASKDEIQNVPLQQYLIVMHYNIGPFIFIFCCLPLRNLHLLYRQTNFKS